MWINRQRTAMSISVQRCKPAWVIRVDGQATLSSAGEMRALLLEWLASGENLQLDLEATDDMDVTYMQLLWAAAREAAKTGVGIACHASEAASAAVRDSGFAGVPGFPISGESHE
jgi:anti-anti-sigma regulatory factor